MELTQTHFEHIAHLFPKQRGNVSLSHLTVLDAILYVAEQGCKWRGSNSRWRGSSLRIAGWSRCGRRWRDRSGKRPPRRVAPC